MVARRSHIRLSGAMVHRGDEFDATPREVEEYERLPHMAEPVEGDASEDNAPTELGADGTDATEPTEPTEGEPEPAAEDTAAPEPTEGDEAEGVETATAPVAEKALRPRRPRKAAE